MGIGKDLLEIGGGAVLGAAACWIAKRERSEGGAFDILRRLAPDPELEDTFREGVTVKIADGTIARREFQTYYSDVDGGILTLHYMFFIGADLPPIASLLIRYNYDETHITYLQVQMSRMMAAIIHGDDEIICHIDYVPTLKFATPLEFVFSKPIEFEVSPGIFYVDYKT